MMNGMVRILFILIFVVIMLAVGILQLIATWKVYKKAGERGWAAIVPFYNLYVMVKITWGNGWLFLLYLVPLGNVVFGIATYIKLARVFGKGGGYAAGLVFFPYVFLSILGFGKAWYQGPDTKKSRGVIIATAVVGGLYVLLMVLVGTLGFAVGLMDGLQDELEFNGSIVEVPILKSENMVVSGSSAVSVQDGVMTTLQLSYAYDEDPAAVVSEMAEMRKESLESMAEEAFEAYGIEFEFDE